MDFLSRTAIARRSRSWPTHRRGQIRVALARWRARAQAAESDARRAIARRTSATTSSVAGVPTRATSPPGPPASGGAGRSRSSRTPTLVYLGPIGLMTLAFAALAVAYAAARRGGLRRWGGSALALLPASELATRHRPAAHEPRCFAPRRLPRLDLIGGVPADARTMVIVPTLLSSVEGGARAAGEHLEVLALGNLDPHSTSRSSATSPTRAAATCPATTTSSPRPGGHRGAERAPSARARTTASSSSTARASGTRGRPLDGMGAEARQARGAQPPASRRRRHQLRRQVGDLSILPQRALLHHARLRHAAAARRRAKLIGIILHPLNHPRFDPALRPRDRGLRHPAAARQRHHGERRRLALRAGLRRPHRRRSLHHRRLGHLPGPLRRGHLHGQGPVRRRRVHGGAGRTRARERAPLARPLRGPPRPHRAGDRRRGRGRLSRRASWPTRGASTAGCAATGRSSLLALPARSDAHAASSGTACR